LSLTVFTQRNFVADFLQAKCDYMEKWPFCVFQSPLAGFGATYDRLPISVNWTFFARCYGWGATSEYRFKIGDFAPTGAGWPKISGGRSRPTNHSYSQKTRLNYLSYGIKNPDITFFRFVAVHAFDRQTDAQTDTFLIASPRWHSMQRGKKVCRKKWPWKKCPLWEHMSVVQGKNVH